MIFESQIPEPTSPKDMRPEFIIHNCFPEADGLESQNRDLFN